MGVLPFQPLALLGGATEFITDLNVVLPAWKRMRYGTPLPMPSSYPPVAPGLQGATFIRDCKLHFSGIYKGFTMISRLDPTEP